jgi:hypothetical protein
VVTSFVLFRVISWIVPVVQRKKDDPRNHTKSHEAALRLEKKSLTRLFDPAFFAAEVPVYHQDHRRTQVQVSQRRSGMYS